jgi:hypothetical protein
LEAARAMARRLIELDGLGIREGLFRYDPLYDAVAGASLPQWAQPSLQTLANQSILVVLLGGIALHFVPAQTTERNGQRVFTLAPAVAIAGMIALIGSIIPYLLAGPRANIYFAF